MNFISRTTDTREVEFEGTYQAVYVALQNLRYKPNSQQNTNRLHSLIFSATSAKGQPFELLKFNVSTSSSGGSFTHMDSLTQMVQIIAVNDAPAISDPSLGYIDPPPACAQNPYNPTCHFGQFFSYEDKYDVVRVTGLNINDVDIFESCLTDLQECKTVDVLVRSQLGVIELNTRSGLSFYSNTRSQKGFTATIAPAVSAIKVLMYQPATESELTVGPNPVNNLNTQSGTNSEFISVVVSDQGNSGEDNLSQLTTMLIKMTIVAVNDSPSIKINVLEFTVEEDRRAFLPSVIVSDPDVNENIVSSLASLDWTGALSNQQYLNKMSLTMGVQYGTLRLAQTRGIVLVATEMVAIYKVTAVKTFVGHDTCRVSGLIESAAKTAALASGGLVGSYRGVCAWKNLPPSQACPTGAEDACVCKTGTEQFCECRFDDTCRLDDTIIIYMNKTKASNYVDVLSELIALSDRTCGGVPTYQAPNNITFGVVCTDNIMCSAARLPTCTYGVNCTCCANITDVCSSDSDCSQYDSGSLCGCVAGGLGKATCGPYCEREKKEYKAGDCTITNILTYDKKVFGGTPCTYASPLSDPGKTTPVVRECRAPVDLSVGSGLSRVLELVTYTVTAASTAAAALVTNSGSRYISILGSLADINAAIVGGVYQTDAGYNRLYRPPLEKQDPAQFDITADSLDSMDIRVSDNGNSGGERRDIKNASAQLSIRSYAVNNPPKANGPKSVRVTEDIPYHFLGAGGLNISDPDYSNYGFKTYPITVNISCSHGRLFLNETFLKATGIAGSRVVFIDWGEGSTSYRGYHTLNALKLSGPVFGDGCQLLPQCSDGANYKSPDNKYGFFATEAFGQVYAGQGCGFCRAETGNRWLSIKGVMDDLNAALSFVTYLPDPNFNTRMGITETISFSVNDNGALGDTAVPQPLVDILEIQVLVESVNDRPIIGRLVSASRELPDFSTKGPPTYKTVSDMMIIKANRSIDAYCMRLVPWSDAYTTVCGARQRQFIDVDEDTVFMVTPDVLWIDDVDSAEAESIAKLDANMPAPPNTIANVRYCCAPAGENGCRCGQPCQCGRVACQCDTPTVCSTGQYGRIMVDLQVNKGHVTFFPPPGRVPLSTRQVTFYTNASAIDVKAGGKVTPCADQKACMQNQTRITLSTTKSIFQKSLQELFLTYRGASNFYGEDMLTVWVSDMNHTDECYSNTLATQDFINIRVVAINDPPMIRRPDAVMIYGRGTRCYSNFQRNAQRSPSGINLECLQSNVSKIPPNPVGDATLFFSDVDLGDRPRTIRDASGALVGLDPHLTVIMTIGTLPQHRSAGSLLLPATARDTFQSFEMFRDVDGLVNLAASGTLSQINSIMHDIRYDADLKYQGYIPIRISVNDNGNLGECRGNHRCGWSLKTTTRH